MAISDWASIDRGPLPDTGAPDWRALMAEHDARPDGYAATDARPLPDDPTAGALLTVGAVVPDPYDGVRHAVRADGRVIRRGTVYVTGDPSLTWNIDAPCASEVSGFREVWSEMVERTYAARTGARGGIRALDIQRMADSILAGSGTPMLLGTDAMSWEQVLRIPAGATTDEIDAALSVVHLNYADPWDAAREWFGIPRPNTPGAVACEHRPIAPSRRMPTRSARLRLTMGRKRRDDVTDAVTYPTDGAACRSVFGVAALIAPTDDPDTRWQGHVLVRRPSVHAKRRAARRAAIRQARTVTCDVDQLESVADSLAPGTRVRYQCDGVRGTIARAASGALSVRAVRADGRTVTRSTLRRPRYVRNVVANLLRVK